MNFEKRLETHYKRWSITYNNEEQFDNFKNRVISLFDEYLGDYLAKHINVVDEKFEKYYKFHEAEKINVKRSQPDLGLNVSDLSSSCGLSWTEKGFGDTLIYSTLDSCQSLKKLATATQIIFWVLEEYKEIQKILSELVKEINKSSVLSKGASFKVHKNRRITVYPCGDELLDKEIIDCTLEGLENYPEASKAFEIALKNFLDKNEEQNRYVLDNLRFALEQLIKKICKNNKSLENQKDYILPWMEEKGLHKQIINLYKKLLDYYQIYQNNAVKHNEDFSSNEIEFMIYLTGNFMRLLLVLSEDVK